MKKLVELSFVLMALVIGCNGYAQPSAGQAGDPAPKVIPPSPEASNLGKFAEIPVSLYTGTPDISIPLYEISKGPLKLNVGLSYHASGIKVEEMASWVGIGWALNAGGVVTRTVRGKPDDNTGSYGNGFFQYSAGKSVSGIVNLPPAQRVGYLQEITEGTADVEPDQYFVNVNGITAQFTFDWNGNLIQTEEKNLKITKIQNSSGANPYQLLGWDITDANGTIYKFREVESTLADPVGSIGPVRNGTFASSWYLSQIVDVNNENTINFTYSSYTLDYGFKPSVTIDHVTNNVTNCGGSLAGNLVSSNTRTLVNGKRIRTISTDDNSVTITFNAGVARTDSEQLYAGGTTTNFQALDNIVLTNRYGAEVKTFTFSTGYATGRLTLNSVTPKKSGQNISPPYKFSYNSTTLPSGLSKAQDHWGYYNGQISNTHLVPAEKIYVVLGSQFIYASGGDRTPSAIHMMAGSLTKIEYPTGGFDEFFYEPHEYGFIQSNTVNFYPPNPSPTTYSVTMTEQEVGETNFLKSVSFVVNGNPNDPTTDVTVNINWSAFTDAATLAKKPWVKLYRSGNPSNPIISQVFGIQDPNQVWTGQAIKELAPGTYYLEAGCKLFGDVNDFANIGVSFTQWSTTALQKKMAGGLRIKTISQSAFIGDPNKATRQFNYVMQASPAQSSGTIYQEPIYGYSTPRFCINNYVEYYSEHYIRLANNVTMLGVTQNSHIGYREVEVIYGISSQINGKSVSRFTSPFEYNDLIYTILPYRPAESHSHKTGLLKSKSDFKYASGAYTLVKEVSNEYSFYEQTVQGLTVLFLGGNSIDGPQLGFPGHYLVGVYNSYLGKAKLAKAIETIYASDNTNGSTTTVNYAYDSYLSRLLKETKDVGNNTKYESNYSYAQDLVSPPQFVTDMISLNVVGVPLYTTQSKIVGSTPYFFGANKSEYTYSSGKLRMLRQTKFNATGTNAPTASFTDQNFSLAVQFDSYDNRGNLLQYTTADGVSSSYVWGYNAEYPIAEAKGATVGSIFHTSFEEDGTVGNAKTGNRSFIGTSYVIPVNKQPIGTNLVMSYWYFNGQWLFQPETTYSATITKSGATAYDEIRVYPAGAQMATYTYDPQIGMTSTTDANNVTTYYEYDSFNRLKQVADRDKSIVKKLTYNYKN